MVREGVDWVQSSAMTFRTFVETELFQKTILSITNTFITQIILITTWPDVANSINISCSILVINQLNAQILVL